MIILTDIHGCYDTLMALLAQIPQEEKDKGIVFCGDLIDRGPKSRQVVEFVKNNGHACVVGNHEQLMIDEHEIAARQLEKGTLNSFRGMSIWIPNGGDKCLYSYEDENQKFDKKLFKEHVEWMKSLPYVLEFPKVKDENGNKLVVSHSSCANAFYKTNFTTNTDLLTGRQKMDIIWGRPGIPKKLKGKFNVYGHTPNPKPLIRDHFANIDTGCYLNGHYEMKHLTALQFPEMIVYQQECIDFQRPKSVFEELDED